VASADWFVLRPIGGETKPTAGQQWK